MEFKYPKPRRDASCVDELHGRKVFDPYRWMEDPDSEETKRFVDEQNAVTDPYLKTWPQKDILGNRLTEMWDYPKYSCPMMEGQRIFYFYNSGLQNHSVLYVQDNFDAEPKVFLDPNLLSADGTVAIRGYSFSENGQILAYGLSSKGSDWVTIKFRDCKTGNDLQDVLEKVKFSSMAWTHDHKGIFYNMYPCSSEGDDGRETKSNYNQKLMYHYIGTAQENDILCIEWPEEPHWMTGAQVSDCGNYVLLLIRKGCDPVNKLYYIDLKKLPQGISGRLLTYNKLIDNFDAEYEFVQNEGTVFTFKTNKNAPRYKLINIDIAKPEEIHWKDLVPQKVLDVLDWAACVQRNKLVLCYLHDVKSVLYVHNLANGQQLAQLPLDIGSIAGYSGKKKDNILFYHFVSFLTPGIIYQCDLATLKPKVFREVKMKNIDFTQFETTQVFYASKDGVKIPMFLVHKKGMKKDKQQPVLMYGYGGFHISVPPVFSVSRMVFLRHLGGMLAIPNLRGGGEYGKEWHEAGTFSKKQNVFDDFHYAAEYLIQQGYTNPSRIAIQGASNGGLLVSACINQRPDLFGCAVAQVGVLDMLRFHKFTIGHAWVTDFGSPDKSEDFDYIYKYSPLHNIMVPKGNAQYPSTLLLTADHDDRVVPLHSLKFIAELQYVMGKESKQKNPLLIKVDTNAGHGAGKPVSKTISEFQDIYTFIALSLKLKWQD